MVFNNFFFDDDTLLEEDIERIHDQEEKGSLFLNG